MKLAVRKEAGVIPGSGFHYMLHPIKMESNEQAAVFEMMGHIIIDVDDATGERLVKSAMDALNHQVEVAVLAESAIK